MTGLEVVAGAGAAASIYGQIAGANAQADAQEKNAANKYVQAQELLQREAINEQLMREQSQKTASSFAASLGGSGVEGNGIGAQLEIHRQTENAILNSRRDAEFKAQMLRAGADVDTSLASDVRTAGWFGAAGTFSKAAAQEYSMRMSSNPTELPAVHEQNYNPARSR